MARLGIAKSRAGVYSRPCYVYSGTPPMRLIDRYVAISFIKNYLISFAVLVGMYIVLDMIFNFDELVLVNAQATGLSAVFGFVAYLADYYFYQGFLFFVRLSGIIPVVAAAFTLMRMVRFNELSALL